MRDGVPRLICCRCICLSPQVSSLIRLSPQVSSLIRLSPQCEGPGFAPLLLSLAQQPDDALRFPAALYFKNLVKKKWLDLPPQDQQVVKDNSGGPLSGAFRRELRVFTDRLLHAGGSESIALAKQAAAGGRSKAWLPFGRLFSGTSRNNASIRLAVLAAENCSTYC